MSHCVQCGDKCSEGSKKCRSCYNKQRSKQSTIIKIPKNSVYGKIILLHRTYKEAPENSYIWRAAADMLAFEFPEIDFKEVELE